MTQPTIIFFGPDSPRSKTEAGAPKVYLRTLLFATSKRGRVIESMHLALERNETKQNFNFWVHGDEKLVRGSGMFVGESGVATNHHFMTPRDGNAFSFLPGTYRLSLYARLLGDSENKLLFTRSLEVTSEIASQLSQTDAGLHFDWGPDSQSYLPHVEVRPEPSLPPDFAQIMNATFLPK